MKFMEIYLVRHGEALLGGADQQRPLSPNGETEVRLVGNYLLTQRTSLANIFHSGLLRAQQSAEILGTILHPKTIKSIKGIAPNDSFEAMAAEISTWTENSMIVSHLPFLAHLLLELTGEFIEFYPATAVKLHYDQNWRIDFYCHAYDLQ